MNTGKDAQSYLKIIRQLFTYTSWLVALTALICWFGGWRTFIEFGSGLIYVGAAFAFLGCVVFISGSSRGQQFPGPIYLRIPESIELHKADISNTIHTAAMIGVPGLLC